MSKSQKAKHPTSTAQLAATSTARRPFSTDVLYAQRSGAKLPAGSSQLHGFAELCPRRGEECEGEEFFSPNSGYTEGVLRVRVKAGFDQGTRSGPVVSSA